MFALVAAPLFFAAAQFDEVKPGGNTSCARGGEWSFFQRAGTENKVVIEFEGGGACWSALTCSRIAGACTTSVDATAAYLNGANSGMHDAGNARNPFRNWHHLFVPYCTCDGHTGTRDHDYGVLGGTMRHRGHTNFLAALEWMKAHFPSNPDTVATTGCSAGSVGALAKWAFLAQAYPNAQQVVFGDSYIGVFAEDQYNAGYANWGMALPPLPGFADGKASKWQEDMGCLLHKVSADAFPAARLGWYTSNADATQTEFYSAGGGSGSFTAAMRTQVACMQKETSNERTFIAAGNAHCRSQDDGFYTVTAAGVNLADWVAGIVSGANAADVDCATSGECNATAALSTTAAMAEPSFASYTLANYTPYTQRVAYKKHRAGGVRK